MGCFGKKSVEVVPCTTEVGPAAGRLEAPADAKAAKKGSNRDGLHSAPGGKAAALNNVGDRAGVHSASLQRTPPASNGAIAAGNVQSEPIGDFLIEGTAGASPTAADVDAYLEDVMGPKIVKDLRASSGAEWSSRVNGLDQLQKLCHKKTVSGRAASATGAADSADAERAALFRGCITVLARLLQDKGAERPQPFPALSSPPRLVDP